MDTYSSGSGEDLIIKARKPYTITKQRERWTEEEHNKFLEALKLYGRAWQRIEEHIGSKTAVQIRSHAQKFFTKLEKEALVKGVPVAQGLDIHIPPPRPKRKPSNPYPRKTCLGTPGTELVPINEKSSPLASFSTHKHEVNLEKEPSHEKPAGDESSGNSDDSPNENDCSEVVNLFQGTRTTLLPSASINSCTIREFVSVKKVGCLLNETSKSDISIIPKWNTKQAVHDDGTKETLNLEMANETDHPENLSALSSNETQATQNYPRHVPVHVLNASKSCSLFPPYPLFDPLRCVQDSYQTYLQASSSFSSLIVSSLLQNPAAHAAASYAASFWACPPNPSSSLSPPPPNMAAIAAATVAAATAWWTSQGLLIPFHNGFFNSNPEASTTVVNPIIDVADKGEGDIPLQNQNVVVGDVANDAGKVKSGKQVDRSSCGSNTPSSSEVETDALEKNALEKAAEEEQPEDDTNQPCDSNNRRGARTSATTSDSWKEVSQEGRLAFRALFSRGVLPQSFSPPKDLRNNGNNNNNNNINVENDQVYNTDEKVEDALELDLNSDGNVMQWTVEIGQGKLKGARRTGFKPYKRCNQDEEKSPKRIRLDGENPST